MGQQPSKPTPEIARLEKLSNMVSQAHSLLDNYRHEATAELYYAARDYWRQLLNERSAIYARMGECCSLHLVTAGLDMRTACLCCSVAWPGWAAFKQGTTLAAAGMAASASAPCWLATHACLRCSPCTAPPAASLHGSNPLPMPDPTPPWQPPPPPPSAGDWRLHGSRNAST